MQVRVVNPGQAPEEREVVTQPDEEAEAERAQPRHDAKTHREGAEEQWREAAVGVGDEPLRRARSADLSGRHEF